MRNEKLNLWTSVIIVAVLLIFSLVILLFFRFLPPKLPLFYSLPWGDNQLASREQFLIIPGTLAIIILLNLTVSWHLHTSQLFFKRILMIGSLISTLILTISFVKIVFIFV